MHLRGVLLLSCTLAGVSPAWSADDFIKGIYMQSDALCAQAKKDGVETVADGGNTVLSARGIESVEYNCEFLQITKATRSPAWVVTAICQEPGYLFPDVLSIAQVSPTSIEVASVTPAPAEGETGGNSGSYVLCEGVTMP